MADLVLERSALLNAYYDNRSLSSLPNQAPFFQFGKVVWGYDLIEMVNNKPTIQTIPLDKKSIANVFDETSATYSYIGGSIIITAVIPAGRIPANTQKHFSCVGIKDAKNNLIAVAVTQPVWLYSSRSFSIEIRIDTARTDKVSSSSASAK